MRENKYKGGFWAGKAGQQKSEGDTHRTQILEMLADASDHGPVGDAMDRYQSYEKPQSQESKGYFREMVPEQFEEYASVGKNRNASLWTMVVA